MMNMWLAYFADRVAKHSYPVTVYLTLPPTRASAAREKLVFHADLNAQAIMNSGQIDPAVLHIDVRSFKFFRRFFSHQDILHTIWLDLSDCPDTHKTAHISSISLFTNIMTHSAAIDVEAGDTAPHLSPAESCFSNPSWLWLAIAWLRMRKTRADFSFHEQVKELFIEEGLVKKVEEGTQTLGRPLVPYTELSRLNTLDAFFMQRPAVISAVSKSYLEEYDARRPGWGMGYKCAVGWAVLVDCAQVNNPVTLKNLGGGGVSGALWGVGRGRVGSVGCG